MNFSLNTPFAGVSMARKVASSWSPASLSGLKLWIAARLETGFNDGDAVTTITDRSSNGANVTQATSTKRALYKTSIVNSKPVFRFDGTDDHYYSTATFDISAGFTLFVVGKNRVRNKNQTLFSVTDTVTSSGLLRHFWRSSTSDANSGTCEVDVDEISGGRTNLRDVDAPPAVGTFYLNTVKDPSGTITQYYNKNTTRAADTSFGPNTLPTGAKICFVGASNSTYLDGDIAELLFYLPELNTTDQQLVEDYLMSLYGLT